VAPELKKFFAACDSETRLRYLFFLDTGCREREVIFACQDDFNFESEDSEFASTYEVRSKPDLGFKTKKGKTRVVPLTPRLAKALRMWFAMIGGRRLVFVNRDGRPEGHFLYKLKNIALKDGLNCGHCKTGKKDEFGNIIPGTELYCKTSPVCKNWTLHKLRRTWATMLLAQPGVNIYEVQERIGHSDLEMLKRYNAVARHVRLVRGSRWSSLPRALRSKNLLDRSVFHFRATVAVPGNVNLLLFTSW
jgi:integrase/recombinase XerD